VSSIQYQKPERQIGLDTAIERHQKDIQHKQRQAKARRQKQIKRVSNLFGY